MKLLFVGDVIGQPGRKIVKEKLNKLKQAYNIDLCVINAENASGGRGLNRKTADELYESGANILTLGNHSWDNKDIFNFIDTDPNLIRPFNYPPQVPGRGFITFETPNGCMVSVAQLCCRLFMGNADCPFRSSERLLEKISDSTIRIIDLHGEATSEKMALGWYLNGRVTALLGTHTHIPTADERILPNGTAYITDVGMTGPYDSVIGIRIDSSTKQFITGIKQNHKVATENVKLCAVFINIDDVSGKASYIERIMIDANGYPQAAPANR